MAWETFPGWWTCIYSSCEWPTCDCLICFQAGLPAWFPPRLPAFRRHITFPSNLLARFAHFLSPTIDPNSATPILPAIMTSRLPFILRLCVGLVLLAAPTLSYSWNTSTPVFVPRPFRRSVVLEAQAEVDGERWALHLILRLRQSAWRQSPTCKYFSDHASSVDVVRLSWGGAHLFHRSVSFSAGSNPRSITSASASPQHWLFNALASSSCRLPFNAYHDVISLDASCPHIWRLFFWFCLYTYLHWVHLVFSFITVPIVFCSGILFCALVRDDVLCYVLVRKNAFAITLAWYRGFCWGWPCAPLVNPCLFYLNRPHQRLAIATTNILLFLPGTCLVSFNVNLRFCSRKALYAQFITLSCLEKSRKA